MEPQTSPTALGCRRNRDRHLPRDDLFDMRCSSQIRPKSRHLRPSRVLPVKDGRIYVYPISGYTMPV